ncbi:DUF3667 domain-containing protein [Sphingomonas humi]|uniref:DUF3667 domain-containing protein n=1 Tax=Sphingomonas humi TaxID=335630 RepID=A0ABP7RF61_9SPHN
MNIVEPIADALTGGIAARAVEPETGLDPTGHTAEQSCLNCGTALAGEFCHACGQRGHVHRTLGSLGHDLLHGVFHFEGKIWHTLPMLAWRPGELTRRYVAGERARFVSPLAIFLFSVFLLATVLASMPSALISDITDGLIASPQKIEEAERKLGEKIVKRQQERSAMIAKGEPTTVVDRDIAKLEDERADLTRLSKDGPVKVVTKTNSPVNSWLDERWRAAKANPQLLLYKVKTSAYKYSWVLIPLSLPLLWLLFPFNRRFSLYDHAIFIIYSLSFMSLLTVVLAVLAHVPAIGNAVGFGFFLIPPWHMYRQLRGAYSLGRAAALIRTALLTFGAFMVGVFWVFGLMLLGAL